MQLPTFVRARKKERGQTIAIVALSLFSLLAMAALAIDVSELYSAHAEAQRAADAAALAGAKAYVDSGFTSINTSDASYATVQTLAQNMAIANVSAALSKNNVAGNVPSLVVAPVFNENTSGNPQVTVQVQQTNLPIFFSKIWGVTLLKVGATATAEAYNPSNSQTNTGNFISSSPKCVKPLLIPNADPNIAGNPTFVDNTSGVVNPTYAKPSPGGFIADPITLQPACTATPCSLKTNPSPGTYQPARVTTNADRLCPTCASGGQAVLQGLECCDTNTYSCGGSTTNARISYFGYLPSMPNTGLACAINPLSEGEDSLDLIDPPIYPAGPLKIHAGGGPLVGQNISTSNSIMTFPIIDVPVGGIPGTARVRVIGFLQIFADDVQVNGQIDGHILNVVGCGNKPSAPPISISGGGGTPLPVRLIHN